MMKAKPCIRKGCQLFVVEELSDEKGPILDANLVLLELKDVFSKELQGLPPQMELDITIKLKPSVKPISKTAYNMTMSKI